MNQGRDFEDIPEFDRAMRGLVGVNPQEIDGLVAYCNLSDAQVVAKNKGHRVQFAGQYWMIRFDESVSITSGERIHRVNLDRVPGNAGELADVECQQIINKLPFRGV